MPANTLDWGRLIVWSLRFLAGIALVGSAASMVGTEEWWVRIWDFPRVQLVVIMLLLAAALSCIEPRRMWWLPALSVLCACWQFYRIYPYTPMAEKEVALVGEDILAGDSCFSVLSYNVLQTNRDYDKTLAMLERESPDVVLLLETDEAWLNAMEPALGKYPSRLDRPLDNKYGLAFATRFQMRDESIQDLAEPDTPSIFATLDRQRPFKVIGLHPRPPRPDQNTDERDAELVITARYAKEQSIPVLAIGDFNDVAWSNTSSLFKRLGGFLDPRVGRGPYATFPANMTWLGWPLDHVFVTEEFLLQDMRVLENTGSDHRAVIANLCLAPAAARDANEEPVAADDKDRSDATGIVHEYQEDTLEDASPRR